MADNNPMEETKEDHPKEEPTDNHPKEDPKDQPPKAPSTSCQSPQYDFESASDCDSNATQVPDCDVPEDWLTPAAKRKQAANQELATTDPNQFQVAKFRKMWTLLELQAKLKHHQEVDIQRNVQAMIEDMKKSK